MCVSVCVCVVCVCSKANGQANGRFWTTRNVFHLHSHWTVVVMIPAHKALRRSLTRLTFLSQHSAGPTVGTLSKNVGPGDSAWTIMSKVYSWGREGKRSEGEPMQEGRRWQVRCGECGPGEAHTTLYRAGLAKSTMQSGYEKLDPETTQCDDSPTELGVIQSVPTQKN